MKTPDEIKKRLGCSLAAYNDHCALQCACCEYYTPGYNLSAATKDAIALIQQLEAKDAEKAQRISELEKKLAAVKRERDAAVFALHGNCDECCWKDTAKCASCVYGIDAWNTHDDFWEWDGVLEGDQA